MSKLVIIGGGAAGTAAAYRLGKFGHDVTIIEKQPQLGGRIRSHAYQSSTIEMGASFIGSKLYRDTFSVIKGSRLESDLRPRNRLSALVRDGIEYEPRALLGNAWLSPGAKLVLIRTIATALRQRRKLDIHQPWRAATYDIETVTDAFSSKSARELLDYVIQPSLEGFFFWPDKTSYAMFLLLVNSMRRLGTSFTLEHGLQQIPEYLASGSTVLLDSEVRKITRQPDGRYSIDVVQGHKSLVLDGIEGIVCATTATTVNKLFPMLTRAQQTFFDGIQYSTTIVLARCYHRSQSHQERTVGYPKVENSYVAATSSHFMKKDTGFLEVIKSYASGGAGDYLLKQSDSQIVEALQNPQRLGGRELGDEQPEKIIIQRWPEALPESPVGHLQNIARFHNGEIEHKADRLVFAGDYIGGPFIEGAISSGFRAAERLHTQLTESRG